MLLQITIDRYDGEKHGYSQYNVDYSEDGTILELLHFIKENYDATLVFTSNCRSAICGACGIKVNGRAMLACHTIIGDIVQIFRTQKIHLQPLDNFKLIRDLAVDWEPKLSRMRDVDPWLVSQQGTQPARQTRHELNKFLQDTQCILCGICASGCNKLSANQTDFYEPYMYSKTHRFIVDSRHKNGNYQLEVLIKKGLWKCMHCQECVSSCPQNVSPAQDIAKMKAISLPKYPNNLGANHALAFYHDIKKWGRLDETMLAPKTEGFLKAATRLPTAIKLLKRGKLKWLPIPKSIKNIKQVRLILSEMDRKEKK